MLRVGLTGGIGSGKSAVAQRLADRGAVVTDADRLAREVVAPGTDGLAEVVQAFGQQVLAADGSLDRAALGTVVFADGEALARLNAITHPRIGARTAELYAAADAAGAPVWVHDVPLLVENGLAGAYEAVIVVETPLGLRLSRLRDRGVAEDDARRRMAHQADDAARREVATYVIDNGGDLSHLDAEVERVWLELSRRRAD